MRYGPNSKFYYSVKIHYKPETGEKYPGKSKISLKELTKSANILD